MTAAVGFGLFTTMLLALLGIVFSRSKAVYFFQVLWIWIVMAFNCGGMDYLVHTGIYNNSSLSWSNFRFGAGFLYSTFCVVFRSLGYDFFIMNFFLASIGLILILKIVKKYSNNPCFVISLLYLCPLFEAAGQKRFFIASAIIIYGMQFLIDEKQNYAKYYICCFLSYGMHFGALLFAFIPLLYILPQKWVIRIVGIGFMMEFLMVGYIPGIAQKLMPPDKYILYFQILSKGIDLTKSVFWLFFLGIHIAVFCLVYRLSICKFNNNGSLTYNPNAVRYLRNTVLLNCFFVLFLPVCFYESTARRYVIYLLIFNYIALGMLKYARVSYSNRFWIISGYSIYLGFTFWATFWVLGTGPLDQTYLLYPFFYENIALRAIWGG